MYVCVNIVCLSCVINDVTLRSITGTMCSALLFPRLIGNYSSSSSSSNQLTVQSSKRD